ncbi:MAG: S8 family serine peptidase [Chloroflexota bacterium]
MQIADNGKRKARRVASLAVGLLLSAGILGAGLASAGIPTEVPGNAIVPTDVTMAGKLYGQLDGKVKNAGQDTRLRVIVHLKDQADLSTWPTNDRAGALRKLKDVAERTQPAVVDSAQAAANVDIYQRYWIFNGFAMEAPAAAIQAVAARSDVAYIVEDGIMTMPKYERTVDSPDNPSANWNIYQVRAPEVWALGYDGTGRVLANQDSGVDGAHEALASRWRGVNGGSPANSWKDQFGTSPAFPIDADGHGTHTMGTIAGYQGDATGTNEVGQSKGATWIACRIYDATGKGPFSYIHGCFQFMADPDGDPNTNDQPDSVGNSWGDSNSYQYPNLEWWGDIEAWRAVGIIPVFSNGNNGPGPATVGKPGAYPIVEGVGATDINRTIAGFSSRGPAPDQAPWNDPANWERSNWGLIKPDIMAPGVNIRSSFPPSSCGGTAPCYGSISGTSMASPHVTGLVGLLRQIRPDLTMNEFYNIIIETAYWQSSFGTKPNNNYGWGEIDDYAAAVYVRDAGAISGTVMDASCAAAVPGADVRVSTACTDANANGECGIRKVVSSNSGGYRTILAAGSYTVTVSAPGYYGMSFNTTVMSSTTGTLPINLVKMPTGVVSGTVTSDGTAAVAGANVSIDGLANIHTTTDAQGNYTLNNVPAGNFTLRADKCGYQSVIANITVNYPGGPVVHNFTMPQAPALLFNDFEDGALTDWTVTGGSAATGTWHNSAVRGFNSLRAVRAGAVAPPYFYVGAQNTQLTANSTWNTSGAEHVWVSFDLYDSAESEYDVVKGQISTDGGATWPVSGVNNSTFFGQASPVHGWQTFCIDVTRWKSAQMKIRFTFTTDGSNWNGETFEGPSLDNIRVSTSNTAVGTVIPAQTPTPGTPVPCTPVGGTATPTQPAATATVGGATATPTACTLEFADVLPGNTFYPFIKCLACRNIINGYPCGGTGEPCNGNSDPYFRPSNSITRGQLAKVVSQSAGFSEPHTGQTFEDVLPGSTFYDYVERLASRGVMGGYPCGVDPNEPCVAPGNLPYFRPSANATRGQLTKIVSNAAGFNDPDPATFTFTDVPAGSTFHPYVERLLINRPGAMNGYPCGVDPNEPCDAQQRPYFRPNATLSRGQTSKIVANTFFPNCQTP